MTMACPAVDVIFMTVVACTSIGFASTYAESMQTCPIPEGGMHCLPCESGTFMKKPCTSSLTKPTCEPCPEHQYNSQPSCNKSCQPCQFEFPTCPKNSVQVTNCTALTNGECRCFDGFYKEPLPEDYWYSCKSHKQCLGGQGMVREGNHVNDTVCVDCKLGAEFVNRTDPKHPVCQVCSTCPQPQSELLKPCSLFNDTICKRVSIIATKNTDGTLGEGAIAGIIVGAFVSVIGLVAIFIYCGRHPGLIALFIYCRRRPFKKNKSDSCNCELLQHEMEYIKKNVFPFLCKNLGADWQQFIHSLPGWPDNASAVTIEHQREEQITVQNRIHGCLQEWLKRCKPHVNKDNICLALTSIYRLDLVRELEQMLMEPDQS